MQAVDAGQMPDFKNFSQILYWFVSSYEEAVRIGEEDCFRYDIGEIVEFGRFRENEDSAVKDFGIAPGNEYPSISLNFAEEDPQADVRERGRLKYSAAARMPSSETKPSVD
jgi:hypothetical protein